MNAKKFSEAMSELDSKYIEEALNYKKRVQKPVWVKWGAMAACLCLIVVAIITVPSMLIPQESDGGAGGTIADAPPMVYVNDTLYKQSTKQTSYSELKDDFVYLGIIDSDITNLQNNSNGNASDGIPRENFQANHPIVGAKVYQYGNNIVVEIEGKYWLYEKVLQEAPTLFAKQSVIDAIEQDITGQEIEGWTETANAIFDLEYVIPIYSTANVTEDSLAILETLAFDNQYMIPVMSNGKCIGTATVAQRNISCSSGARAPEEQLWLERRNISFEADSHDFPLLFSQELPHRLAQDLRLLFPVYRFLESVAEETLRQETERELRQR